MSRGQAGLPKQALLWLEWRLMLVAAVVALGEGDRIAAVQIVCDTLKEMDLAQHQKKSIW